MEHPFPFIFSLIPLCCPVAFLSQDSADPIELLPIIFAQIVGRNEEQEDLSMLLHTTSSNSQIYCTEEYWQG